MNCSYDNTLIIDICTQIHWPCSCSWPATMALELVVGYSSDILEHVDVDNEFSPYCNVVESSSLSLSLHSSSRL